jgi:predicted metal-binding protein
MKSQDLQWKTGIWICSKCGKNFPKEQLQNTSAPPDEVLRDYLREELKKQKASTEIRVMTSGCMKVCVKDEITVTVTPSNKAFIVHPEKDKEELLARLLSGDV